MAPGFHEAMDAVRRGDTELLRRRLQLQPTLIDAVDAEQHPSTLLHTAAAGEHPVVVSLLLALGAAADSMTWATPLHVAASYGRAENARILLEAGAAFDARTRLGTTPLAMAVLHGHPEVADLLSPRGILPHTLWVAAGAGALDLVKSFLRPEGILAEGADQHREDPHEYGLPARPRSDDGTPLHWAAYCGHGEMVKYLLQRGADPFARDDEWQGTPSSWAAQGGHEAIAEFLGQYESRTQG